MMRHQLAALNYKVTLEKYKKKEHLSSFKNKSIMYATFDVKQRTYYANVKENFIAQVNVVLWLWDHPKIQSKIYLW